MATTISIAGVLTNAGSTVNQEITVTDATWKSPHSFIHLYSSGAIPVMLDQVNNILYLHDESGSHLITFDNTQAAQTTVTGQGQASDAADLYSKIKAAFV